MPKSKSATVAGSVPFPELATTLRALGADPCPGYHRLYKAAVDGRIPVLRSNGRLYVARADFPQIAATLGFRLPSTAA